jgi:transposase
MRLICGSKHKNDAIDAERIAHLLRSNMLPLAYAYPAERRFVRDMLRMRSWLVQQRAHQVGRLNILLQQHGHTDLCGKLDTKKGRTELGALIAEPSLRTMIEAGCTCIKTLDEQIGQMQTAVQERTNATLSDTQNLLLSIPGMGPVLSQTILYEIDSIRRFKKRQNFSSYCRLVNPLHTSDGKTVGHGNRKCGNAYLKWALMQCVTGMLKAEPDVRNIADKLKTRYAPLKARAILANRLATAIFYMLKHDIPFDIRRFCRNTVEEADSPEQSPVAAQAA